MATGLEHIKDNQFHESVFNEVCNKFSWGPLEIDYCLDLTIPQVTFSISVKGIKIGSGTINPTHPCLTIGGSVLGVKAEVTVCIDPAQKQVTYDAELCIPLLGCQSKKGILFSW